MDDVGNGREIELGQQQENCGQIAPIRPGAELREARHYETGKRISERSLVRDADIGWRAVLAGGADMVVFPTPGHNGDHQQNA